MASISTIAVQLTAFTGQFDRKMKGAAKTVSRTAASITGSLTRARVLGGAALTALAGGGLAFLVKQSIDTAGSLNDMSARLGESTANLAKLGYAGKQAGVSIETMERALQRMQRNVVEAAQGTGEAQDSIRRLGVSAQQLAMMRPAQQFVVLTKAFERVRNSSERTAIAMEIFGRGGAELLSVINQGSAALEEQARKAERLGIALSDIDAAKLDAAGDAIEDIKLAVQGVTNVLAIELAPLIVAASEKFADLAAHGEASGKSIAGAFDTMATAIDTVLSLVGKLKDALKAISVSSAGLQGFGGRLYASIRGLEGDLFEKLAKLGVPGAEKMAQQARKYEQAGYEFSREMGRIQETLFKDFVSSGTDQQLTAAKGGTFASFLEEARAKLAKSAADTVRNIAPGTGDLTDLDRESKDKPPSIGAFLQEKLSRVALGDVTTRFNKAQLVESKADKPMLAMLDEIRRNTRGGSAVFAE